jgi:hypothetical protein
VTLRQGLNEVGGQRGAVLSLDLLETLSSSFIRTVLFQPPLPEPDRHLSAHPALQAWNVVCLDCLSPYGSRPPPHNRGHFHSPVPLPHVSGITPIIRVLRELCHHAGRPVKVIPSSHVSAGSSLGSPFRWVPRSLRVAGVGCLLHIGVSYAQSTPQVL